MVQDVLQRGAPGPYLLQAAIAAVHAESASFDDTDWTQIVALYGLLADVAGSPVVELNRAVAVAMRDGPARGLELVDGLMREPRLERFHLLHAARADLLRRLGRTQESILAYEKALALEQSAPERAFLEGRIAQLRRPQSR